MASDTNHKSAENTKSPLDTTVNGDNGEERHNLLGPYGTHPTLQHAREVYGGIQQGQNNEENLLGSITSLENSISRARQLREVKKFPYIRGRVTALAIIFCYMVSTDVLLDDVFKVVLVCCLLSVEVKLSGVFFFFSGIDLLRHFVHAATLRQNFLIEFAISPVTVS